VQEAQRLHQADELRGLAGFTVPDDHRGAHARERHAQLVGAPRHALVRLHLGRLVGAVLPVEAAQRSGVVHVEGARRPALRAVAAQVHQALEAWRAGQALYEPHTSVHVRDTGLLRGEPELEARRQVIDRFGALEPRVPLGGQSQVGRFEVEVRREDQLTGAAMSVHPRAQLRQASCRAAYQRAHARALPGQLHEQVAPDEARCASHYRCT
jgi:hypothetical protein